MQLQTVAIALTANDQLGQDVLGVVQPQLGDAKGEVARHADQQDFQQGLQVRHLQQHVLQLLGLQIQVAVHGDRFGQAALPQLRSWTLPAARPGFPLLPR